MHINRNKRKAKVEEIKPVITTQAEESFPVKEKFSTPERKKTLLELIEEEENKIEE